MSPLAIAPGVAEDSKFPKTGRALPYVLQPGIIEGHGILRYRANRL